MRRGRKDSVTPIFIITAAGCLGVDLVSKSWIISWSRANGGEVEILPGWFGFRDVLNEGGIWSFLSWMGSSANVLLAGFSTLAVIAILLWGCFGLLPGERMFAVVLGMILGGACGNLYDRFVFKAVRDFIDVHYYDVYHYPTFNLADSFLVCGAVLIFLGSLRQDASTAKKSSQADAAGSGTASKSRILKRKPTSTDNEG